MKHKQAKIRFCKAGRAGKAGKAGMAGQASKIGPKIATIGFGFWQAKKLDKGLL